MKKAIAIFVMLVLVTAIIRAASPEPKYKYNYFKVEPIYFQRTLDAAGADGYRVVSIIWMETYFFIVVEKQYFSESE